MMDMNEYQEMAKETNIYPDSSAGLYAMTLGLCGESGEFADKMKKIIRDEKEVMTEENRLGLALELGDVQWYLSQIASRLGIDLSTIGEINIEKLKSRKERGRIGGSGDER